KAGVKRLIALTHGHEVGWAALPVARAILRRIGDSVDTVTYLGDYTRVRLARALSPAAVARMTRLTPGVDTSEFYPGAGGQARTAAAWNGWRATSAWPARSSSAARRLAPS